MPEQKNVIQRLRAAVAENPKRIVFPETQDPRVVEAAKTLVELQLATPVMIGGEPVSGTERIDPSDSQLLDECARRCLKTESTKASL